MAKQSAKEKLDILKQGRSHHLIHWGATIFYYDGDGFFRSSFDPYSGQLMKHRLTVCEVLRLLKNPHTQAY